MDLSVKNGYESFNIWKLTDCLVQATNSYSSSLTSHHENCPCYPLTSRHGFYCNISNLPLLATIAAAIAIVSCNQGSPYQVLISQYRMKRTREESATTATSSTNNSLHIPWNKAYQHIFPAASGTSTGTPSNSNNARVLVNPKVIPPREKARLAEELRETKYRDKVCQMCSSTSKTVHHHHFSSSDIRRMVMTDSRTTLFVG